MLPLSSEIWECFLECDREETFFFGASLFFFFFFFFFLSVFNTWIWLTRFFAARPRALSRRVGVTGELKFVYLLCKGDLRQWFTKLNPVDGVLSVGAVHEFVSSFCKSMSLDVPKDEIEEFLENVAEVKFHEFVLLSLLITKPLRALGRLELDEELLEDAESTSEVKTFCGVLKKGSLNVVFE
jgi:hypothetical protein